MITLQQLKDIWESAIVTLGSAIGTKARLIAGSDGTNARAIKTNASGEVLTVLTGSNVPQVIHTDVTVTAGSNVSVEKTFKGNRIGISYRLSASVNHKIILRERNPARTQILGAFNLVDAIQAFGSVSHTLNTADHSLRIENPTVENFEVKSLVLTEFI